MNIVRPAGVALAIVAAVCGAAAAQASKPNYEEALNAVTAGVLAGACERTETERYLRFHCEEGQALWYFTVEGRPEHQGYFVAPVRPVAYNDAFTVPPPDRWSGQRVFADFGYSTLSPRAASAEEARERGKAQQAWMKEILEVSREDAASMEAPRKRERGRLYPLESS